MHKFLYIFIAIFFSFQSFVVKGQSNKDTLDIVDEMDPLPIELEEVEVYSFEWPPKFDTEKSKKDYYILKYRVQKVYKYARLAAERLRIMEQTMDTIKNRRLKKIYVKRMQKYIEQRFTEELKNLSRSQGRILVKLIDRQTGRNAYDLVKELRNGWSAFWYNNTAWLYNISLKSEYDPENVKEDYLIEDILRRSFSTGELDFQDPAMDIDYMKLRKKWEGGTNRRIE